MKIVLTTLAFMLIMGSCQEKKNHDPKAVLTEYYDHIRSGEFDKAKAMSNEQNKAKIVENYELSAKEIGLEKWKEKFASYHLSIGDPVIEGKYATLPLYQTGTDQVEHQKLELQDNIWIVLPPVLR